MSSDHLQFLIGIYLTKKLPILLRMSRERVQKVSCEYCILNVLRCKKLWQKICKSKTFQQKNWHSILLPNIEQNIKPLPSFVRNKANDHLDVHTLNGVKCIYRPDILHEIFRPLHDREHILDYQLNFKSNLTFL